LLSAFSALKLDYNVASGTASENLTESYTTVYASPTTFKVNVASAVNGENTTATVWILKSNGTALAIDEAGANLTGPIGQDMVIGLFAGFSAEVEAGAQLSTYAASQYFHSTGTASVTLGTSTFTVTEYAANTLPETVSSCSLAPTTLTSFALAVGTPKGSSYELVTSMTFGESSTSGGVTTTTDVSVQVVSLTVA